MHKYLWRFYWYCGRMGNIEGLFVATEEEIRKAIGKDVYFGEIFGKYSEIYGTLHENDFEKIDIDPETVEKVTKYLGENWSGYNPLDYIRYCCDACECSYNREEMWKIEDDECICEYCHSED